MLFLLLGLGLMMLFQPDVEAQDPHRFWWTALGVPALIWVVSGLLRMSLYSAYWGVLGEWNEIREQYLAQHIRQGRRSQQVLAVSLHTALRAVNAHSSEDQCEALLGGTKALTSQADWLASEEGARHSRLAIEPHDTPEVLLRRVLGQVLGDIAQMLARLPTDKPLALLVESHSRIPQEDVDQLWQDVWSASGIRQSVTRIEGQGLAVVDEWLDQRINDQALLLVVAFQLAPVETPGTGEAVVGLLFGNRLTQDTLAPLAYLHRPEPARAPSIEGVGYAIQQALYWGTSEASTIGRLWLTGMDAQRTAAISRVVSEAVMPVKVTQGWHDLDAMLGHPGCAAPWVAVAAAVESTRNDMTPQMIVSGDQDVEAWLWSAVIVPASSNPV
ncbi:MULTISPECIES: hypothetical protein [unclassified Pseudomonas]|uniref:hypothetical protein n=1 Tax=unclassified Pseudomonas TaxID=196821 RepID=UPI002114A4F9|nr:MULTISPECIES: hypothetical protein [unclassified Pseudomonas]